jgi:transposase
MPASARVVSCYEAGRDGFWLHRHLRSVGIENEVIDAASIEVNRRLRHVKTDRLDGERLLAKLIRHHTGERDGWRVVRAPSLEEEDARRLHRELERLKRERLAHRVRIQSLLAVQGIRGDEQGRRTAAAGDAHPVGRALVARGVALRAGTRGGAFAIGVNWRLLRAW